VWYACTLIMASYHLAADLAFGGESQAMICDPDVPVAHEILLEG